MKGNKPFWVCSFVEILAAFQTDVLEIVHTKAFCQQTTESWPRQDSIAKSSLFLSLCVLVFETYKNAGTFVKTKSINETTK